MVANAPPSVVDSEAGASDLAIETLGLTKDYGAGRGVFELDLRVRRGEIMGFLGPNGAGKSTTMRLLLGLIGPTAGGARVLGFDITGDGIALRRRVGYLAGDFGLHPQLTGGAVIDHFARLHGDVNRTRIGELAERFDVQLDRRVRELSSGNRQKLGLIQALMHDPELLILDEPITGLDPLVQQTFHQLLVELRERGRTTLLSSHTLSEVDRVADRVAILRAGRLVVVDQLDRLRAAAVRRWEIEFARTPGLEVFRQLPGVTEVAGDATRVTISFKGAADALLKAVAAHPVIDLRTGDGDLEQIFLQYYRDPEP